jgi:serine/threonine-protein kinase
MGIVYRALDRVLDEPIALKMLAGGGPQAELARRLRQEIKLARRVTHPNVCRIHEYGEDQGLRYVSMELVDGEDLKRRIHRAALSQAEVFDVALQALAGLEAIHKAGIIHRDLKTANLMLERGGTVKVMDFGIAKPAGGDDVTGLTHAGQIVGSPEYMSPEQARGQALDLRSDVYSMGVVLFELFSGRVPFHGDSPLSTVLKHLSAPPPLEGALAARLPPSMLPVLRVALAKGPDDRFSSASHLADAVRLARAAEESGQSAPTWTMAGPTPAELVSGGAPAVAPGASEGAEGERAVVAPPAPRRPGPGWVRVASAALTASLLVALALWLGHGSGPSAEPPARATPAAAPLGAAPSPSAPSPAPSARLPPRPERTGPTAPVTVPRPELAVPPAGETVSPSPGRSEALELPTVPIGADLAVSITSEIRSDRTRPGSTFTAELVEPLFAQGREVVPAGARLTGRVAGAGVAPGPQPLPYLELSLSAVEIDGQPAPIRTGLYRLVAPPPVREGGPSLTAVVVGSAAGALLGAAAGGRSAAVGGAAVGAAIGVKASSSSRDAPQEYRFGSRLTFRLAEPLAVSPVGQPRSHP